ncbi:thioredoxin domain-containing protein [Desulfosporosinus orientis DSM 765]|uniref:Thioredoxin domain-containing protein n=1 Tax=Desulfosporosinus orientis (strain ATCC 19365 / DSM 765 / NCIMB 8382 / VKM B-1628 / Singapore I) TaxID=768706 RepID=G7W8A9_DESOD|nr:thioredoxin domain-containing protein [Desulfosporosinus orientis]AET67049.1 thioredoxin domain-containing protein [Desulfosporosinus orientis DSM 765]
MVNSSKPTNRLINEKSPYLLQHAYNPVNWYPWGEEAFTLSKRENKPIFLSIGYSTCHWCHVMERESFEDEAVAALLNRWFISIKVDREERPDVDHMYMAFCQALTGSGGWPLTIIMTPEKKPFFAGTYFPKTEHHGYHGLMELLEQVGTLWRTSENKLRESADQIVAAVQSGLALPKKASTPIDNSQNTSDSNKAWEKDVIDKAYAALEQNFDPRYGGFGRAPKFPSPHTLTFLLRYAENHPQSNALAMVRKTLNGMARGGMYDHIGFGFARYSTDEKWLIPHFEKMLYDNALLALAYLESFQVTHSPEHAKVAQDIFTYVLRDMTSPEGGFYSAEDADAEDQEGKFHVWTPQEVEAVLDMETAQKYCSVYDISAKGNFEGKSIPNLLQGNIHKLDQESSLAEVDVIKSLESARQALFSAREKRIHPHKDDKILTSWNGLMIAALAKGAQVLGNKTYLEAGEKAADFILTHLRRVDGRLLARYREGDSAILGYLDDYSFFIWGLLELYFASGKPLFLQTALLLQEEQDRLFFDTQRGGYFLTGSDGEKLLFRPKESYDGAIPSGNSITTLNLLRFGQLTGSKYWKEKAEQQLLDFRTVLEAHPSGYTAFLQALQFALHPTQELILAGSLDSEELSMMRNLFFSEFRPYASVLYQEGSLGELVPWIENYPLASDQTAAYLCQNFTCQQPVYEVDQFARLLEQF